MFTALRNWSFWSFIYPERCAHCAKQLDKSSVLFCDACWAELRRAEKTPNERLPRHIDQIHAGFAYLEGGLTREVVHALKFSGHVELTPKMAELLIRTLPVSFIDSEDVWVPVPLHWLRRGDRAFNQSELLVRSLLVHTGGKLRPLLRRTRNTPAQSGQGFRRRAENVRGAFAYRERELVPKSVLLVDDVVTTGATVSECARVLKEAGVERVRVLAFARAE